MRSKIIILGLAVLIIVLFITAKSPYEETWQLTNITGNLPDLQFTLTSDTGKLVTEKSYRNKVVLLYFGFTQCPSVCPLTMARMVSIFKRLGNDANAVELLFVTVDPIHDTPQRLNDYISSLDAKHMVGLTGENSDINALAKRYRAVYQPNDNSAAIVHSDTIYIFDGQGHARLLARADDLNEHILIDLKRLIHVEP